MRYIGRLLRVGGEFDAKGYALGGKFDAKAQRREGRKGVMRDGKMRVEGDYGRALRGLFAGSQGREAPLPYFPLNHIESVNPQSGFEWQFDSYRTVFVGFDVLVD